ncbi:MAG: hypothetical protein GY862_37880 [Gammaproteobacteria bacterium]|nr:hypothetical protein [Gammaproteobacteria bacterium]
MGGHKGKACEVLGISRPQLRRLIKEYGLTLPGGIKNADREPFETEVFYSRPNNLDVSR